MTRLAPSLLALLLACHQATDGRKPADDTSPTVDTHDSRAEHTGETASDSDSAEDSANTDSGTDSDSGTDTNPDTDSGSDSDSGGESGDDSGTDTSTPPPDITWSVDKGASLTIYSDTPAEFFGWPRVVGDVTGDGIDDLIIEGQAMTCYGFWSPIGSGWVSHDDADYRLEGLECDRFASGIGYVGDINADGFNDIASTSYIFLGPLSGVDGPDTADVTLTGTKLEAISAQDAPGDSNGDGIPEVIVEVLADDPTSDKLYVFNTVEGPTISISEADANADPGCPLDAGESCLYYFGFVGDTDGDGFDDLFYGGYPTIGARLSLGPLAADFSTPDAIVDMGEGPGGAAGDVNGDGYADLVIGPTGTGSVIRVAIFQGPLGGDLGLKDASAIVDCGHDTGRVDIILDVAGPGDVDGDGLSDLFYSYDSGDSHESTAWLFLSPLSGTLAPSDATREFYGTGMSRWYVDGPSDLDGDGLPDLIIGNPLDGTGAYRAGMAWVLKGGSFL